MSLSPAVLALADGTVFRGESIGADGVSVGEVVFNTAMTGYLCLHILLIMRCQKTLIPSQ